MDPLKNAESQPLSDMCSAQSEPSSWTRLEKLRFSACPYTIMDPHVVSSTLLRMTTFVLKFGAIAAAEKRSQELG